MNDQEVLEAKGKIHQYRVRQNFNRNYRERGGIAKLETMIASADTTEVIGKWFGISASRIGIILQGILGVPYSTYLASRKIYRSRIAKS